MSAKITEIDSNLTTLNTFINQNINTINTNIHTLNQEIETKVNQTEYTTSITSINAAITKKVNISTYENQINSINKNLISIDTDINNFKETLLEHSDKININADNISTLTSKYTQIQASIQDLTL